MPTFVLKKYEEQQPAESVADIDPNVPGEKQEPKLTKEMTVEVTGSISEIVARALNKVLVNKGVEIEEQENAESAVKAISTEDINKDPVTALRSVTKADVLFINGKGFTTAKEEWFLTNVESKVGKIFYSVEAFVSYIAEEFDNVQNT